MDLSAGSWSVRERMDSEAENSSLCAWICCWLLSNREVQIWDVFVLEPHLVTWGEDCTESEPPLATHWQKSYNHVLLKLCLLGGFCHIIINVIAVRNTCNIFRSLLIIMKFLLRHKDYFATLFLLWYISERYYYWRYEQLAMAWILISKE